MTYVLKLQDYEKAVGIITFTGEYSPPHHDFRLTPVFNAEEDVVEFLVRLMPAAPPSKLPVVQQIRKFHTPRYAELDQSGGEDGMVCSGHDLGYPPPWPCTYEQLCRIIDNLEADLEAQSKDD